MRHVFKKKKKVPSLVGWASFTILRSQHWFLQKDFPTNLLEMLAFPSFLSNQILFLLSPEESTGRVAFQEYNKQLLCHNACQ